MPDSEPNETQTLTVVQVQVVMDTAQGAIKVSSASGTSMQSTHLSASISKLTESGSATRSIQGVQQAPAGQKRLAQLLFSEDGYRHDTATLSIVHQPRHIASEAEVLITQTDASLQLAGLHQASSHERLSAGMVAKWDAVQLLPASPGMQQHAAAQAQQASHARHGTVSNASSSGQSTGCSMEGVEARSVLSSGTPGEPVPTPTPSPEATSATSTDAEQPAASPQLSASRPEEVFSTVQAQIISTVTKLLDTDSIGHDEPLMAAGLDSLAATELAQSLQSAFDISLPATMVFDYPTVTAMAAFISQQLMHGMQELPATQAGAVALSGNAMSHDVGGASHMALISGVAGDEKLLQQWTSGDAISRVPHSRWDVSQQAKTGGSADTLAPLFGSFLSDVEQFDSALFGVMASEALTMDPQQRLLLQTALEAFPSGPSSVRGKAVGAYVGVGTSDYNTLMQQSHVPFNAFSFTAGSASVASGRLAFAFGLQGPTASIDTACSASLVAAHMACQSFR